MIRTAMWLAVLVIIFVAAVRYMEKKSLFFPMEQITSSPGDVGLDHEEVYFHTSDGKKIHSWFIPGDKGGFTILFSCGNAGNISHRLDKIAMMNDMGFNVFIFGYRGYGKSEGIPSEKGFYRDIDAAYEYLVDDRAISPENIILYGESIGGGVVIELASRRPAGALITEEAFTSVKDMARLAFPLIPHIIFSSRFDNLAKIGDVDCPKLIIHSVDDEIVPFSQGERLFEAAGEPKKFLRLRGGHNTAFRDSMRAYKEGIRSFVSDLN
ncbi:MAG: alpha/beta hydrolase [Candidatus Omnitrophota bacterium]